MEEILSGLAAQPSAGGPRRPASGPPAPPTRSTSSSAAPSRTAPPSPAAPSLSPFAASTLRTQQTEKASGAFQLPERVTEASFVKGHDFNRADVSGERSEALTPDTVSSAGMRTPAPAHETSGSLALAEAALAEAAPEVAHEPMLESGPQIVPTPNLASSGPPSGTDFLRTAVVQSLESGGHATAAAILDDGLWTIEPGLVKIEVMAKATMIRITFNAAAEKLIRQALSQAGAPSRFLIVPGAALSTTSGPAKSRAPQGSIEAEARNHPLVVQAQAIFNAEICSVVDLREK